MVEPHSTVVAGALYGASISSVTILFGAQVDALVIGLAVATFVSIWLETIDNKMKAASAVLLSAILAGYGSPVAASWAASTMSGVTNTDSLRLLLAALIACVSPALVPTIINLLKQKIGGGEK